ncbi:hypothetical protein HPB51_016385 [Rhipicephalus microplus]|uniref:Reverse transcriptase domain-containing protein n=1 Tax=Rhipicephalus microplus TaxID=6941 RepID=A0A9J6DIN5_RHIMP|nr:hypothetical protein HPB51_016385 [Rhipicephalus microplus]
MVTRGLKQGCPLSPLLYMIYVSGLEHMLLASSMGFSFTHLDDGMPVTWKLPGLVYADDVKLLAESPTNLQQPVTLAATYLYHLDLAFNAKKSAALNLSGSHPNADIYLPGRYQIQQWLERGQREVARVALGCHGHVAIEAIKMTWDGPHLRHARREVRPLTKNACGSWTTNVKTQVCQEEMEQWRHAMKDKSTLLTYHTHKADIGMEPLCDNSGGSALLFEARGGALRMLTYRHRFDSSADVAQALCRICGTEEETTKHIVLHCADLCAGHLEGTTLPLALGFLGDKEKSTAVARAVHQLEATVEDVRRELSAKEDLVEEAWRKVDSINTELTKSKEKVEFLRTRMRTYRQRISELEKKPGAKVENEDEELGASAAPVNSVPAATQQPPVVTQLSVCAESPSKAEFCVTVSALRSPASATGTPAAKIFKRTLSQPRSAAKTSAGVLPSAISKTTVMKRSLFSQSSSSCQLVSVLLLARGSRCVTPIVAGPAAQVSAEDKENIGDASRVDAAEKRKTQQSPQIHPNTRTWKQLALGLSPFGRDSSNIRPRTESAAASRTRPQRVQQPRQHATIEKAASARSTMPAAATATASAPSPKASGAPSGGAPKPASGVLTRAQRASAGKAKAAPKGKTDEQADCKMQ